jgi:subfamily B ATP-binding cassette protein MsbA
MNTMNSSALYSRLLRQVRPYWRTFGLGVLGIMVTSSTEPLLPALLKPWLDGVFVDKDPTLMHWTPVVILALFLVRGLADFVAQYCINWVGHKVVMDLRAVMFAQLLKLPAPFYDNKASGTLLSKLTFDVTQVTSAATSVLMAIFRDTLIIVGLLVWMVWLNWRLTLLALVMGPVIVIFMRFISERLRTTSRQVQNQMGELTQAVQETIEAHRVIKLFGGQRFEQERFDAQANSVRRQLMRQVTASATSVPIVQFIAAMALATIMYLATQQSASDQLSVGGFVSFVAAMMMLTAPLKRLTSVNDSLQRGLAAAESIYSLIDQPGEPDSGTVSPGRVLGEISFDNVCFAYEAGQHNALEQIQLKIEPGQTIALVGASGSGKTTLANMVPRFYLPNSGCIRIDGTDISQFQLSALRDNIALVSQNVVLFNDTIAANIAYGSPNQFTQEEIIAAAQAAHAMEFIQQLPLGLKTMVGENGVKLSGGQRQRLAIARALLKNAPILILDEATSALDNESERHVQGALEVLMKGRTTLVVAHRLSTIERADRIVVLEAGRIVESGMHQSLLDHNGVYARLYRMQFSQGA